MSMQNQIEHLLKEIHLMAAGSEPVKGSPGKIIIDKQELLDKLEAISKSMYDMMDEYAVSQQGKNKIQKELREQGEAIIEDASAKAEDVYAASVLYMDDAIVRLVRVMEEAQRSADEIYKGITDAIDVQKRSIRTNQSELQDQLFEMRDSNLYLNILDERRRKIAKAKTENQIVGTEKTWQIVNHLQESSMSLKAGKPEIKVNPAYFEKTGKTLPGEIPLEEPKAAAPEVKVNLNSNYFKWKMGQNKKSEGKKQE